MTNSEFLKHYGMWIYIATVAFALGICVGIIYGAGNMNLAIILGFSFVAIYSALLTISICIHKRKQQSNI